MAEFHKVGLLTFRGERFLMCRKNRVTSRLILPGGRIEIGESEDDCLKRELLEELGEVSVNDLTHVGRYSDIAHADDPSIVDTLHLSLYTGELVGKPRPCSEIIELVWFGPDSDPATLTPIFTNRILPDLRRRKLIAW